MLSRFSVKKPFYILAAVIIILLLGVFSLSYMKTNLLPSIDLPYLAVITTDPGASPEQVENDVSNVLEDSLATVTGVETVYSMSYENYSMVFLEFAEDTDMNSALVKVSAAVNKVSSNLPDNAGTPMYLEISMDSVATMYLGISDSEMDQNELSQYVTNTMVPAFERQSGVASVSTSGLMTQQIDIVFNENKIESINNRILSSVNDKLAETKQQLDEAQSALNTAKAQLEEQQAALQNSQSSTLENIATQELALSETIASKQAYEAQLTTQQAKALALQAQIQAATTAGDAELVAQLTQQLQQLQGDMQITQSIISQYEAQAQQIEQGYVSLETGAGAAAIQYATAQSQIASALSTIESSQSELSEGYASYNTAREAAINSANIDTLMSASTLSQILSAQSFSMPAGYIEDDAGNKYMLKIGDTYDGVEQLRNMVLTNIDGVGDIKLNDVADINVIAKSSSDYAKLNGRDGIILSVTKTSTTSTSDVSNAINEELKVLQEETPTLDVMTLTDQGKYITLYITTILQSLIFGAILAFIVLALFLRDVKPTLVVAFSIPFSVLFALVIMYFWGIDINIMSLGALSLAIGMLVDNSVVVMENIYRLRARGLSAPRAAAQGAKQVSGAVIASTLTTVCVFLPFVFTTGLVRQLLVPFALTISFTLIASLIVALTAVPALGSTLFTNIKPYKENWFDRFKERYGGWLAKCLDHKAPVLIVAIALLIVCSFAVTQMGITLIPDMESDQVSITITMDEEMEEDAAYAVADDVLNKIASVEGVQDVGIADGGTSLSTMVGTLNSGVSSYTGTFMCYIIPDSSITTDSAMANLKERITQATADCDCELSVSSASSMMSSVTGSGLTVNLTGDENDTLLALSNQVVDAIESIEGYENASNGQETADATIKLSLDANLLAQQGTTVAQVYQQIAGKLNSTVSSITLNDDAETEVSIVDNRNQITPESLLETTYTVSVTGTDGTTSTKEHKLSEVGSVQMQAGVESLTKTNGVHSISVTADVSDGYNTTLLSRQLEPKLAEIDVPDGYKIEIGGNNEQIYDMLEQMAQLMALGALLIYLVMMAQFQSIMMPLIIIVTVPLAFTGGLLALLIAGEQLSVMSLLGFVILMGTVVNNGIVFVDYTNQLRRAGMPKRTALIAAGKTRMRPILVTALTTILSMCALIFNPAIGASLQRGMALVVAGGLLYATIMTLLVVPIVYDIMSRKPLKVIDIGSDIDEETGDAEYFMNEAEIEASNHEVSNHEVSNQAEFVAEENTGTSKYQSPYTNL